METDSTSTNKKPFWKLNRRERSVALVMLAGILIGVSLPSRIIIATSDSLDHRIFFKVPLDPAKIQLGDYLLFTLGAQEGKPYIRRGLKETNILIKKVGCIPGKILTKDAGGVFYCQQNKLGKALEKDSKGNELPVFNFIGPIPLDSYFMMGTNPRSFDSRYFGLIHGNEFISKALPIW